ncbi:MAG: nucleoside triphosphate pyrophosphohydrolase [Chloroflexota bacterium]
MDALTAALRLPGLDPADGIALIPLDALVRRPVDPGMALVVLPPAGRGPDPAEAEPPAAATPDAPPFLPVELPGRHGHGDDPLALLRRLYPADHAVVPLGEAGPEPATTLAEVTAAALAARPHLLPRLAARWNAASPFGLPWLVARLRAPGGCPWDREQDHLSLRPFLLEESYEVYDALEAGSTPDLAEELGDLLLQIVLHAQYAAEAGVFDLADVYAAVTTKIIRRHPHVFADAEAHTSGEVLRNWEQIKAAERAAAGTSAGGADAPVKKVRDASMPAAFAGLSRSLPALAYADEMQSRAAALGYDWPDLEGVIDKIAEEASELLAAETPEHRTEEYGDLLFVMVNMARKLGIDPEGALRQASKKFASRFARVERFAAARGLELRALGLDALDELWQDAKIEEAEERASGASTPERRDG